MEMGTGKSKVVVDEFGWRVYCKDVSDLLLIAPAGCYRNWDRDASEDDLAELHKHLDPQIFEKLVVRPWRSGGGKQHLELVRALMRVRGRPRAFIVNVEALSSVERAIKACEEFIDTSERGVLLAIDESTIIANGRANRSEAVEQLGLRPNIAAKRILTGLVAPNSPMNIWSQFNFLDPRIIGFRSFVNFRSRYAIQEELKIGGMSDQEARAKGIKRPPNPRPIVAYRNIEELHEKIAPYSFRVLKEDCLDLPPKVYMPIREVPLTKEQKRIYLEMKEFATARLASETYVTATMVLTHRLRLSQILNGYVKDEEGVHPGDTRAPDRRAHEGPAGVRGQGHHLDQPGLQRETHHGSPPAGVRSAVSRSVLGRKQKHAPPGRGALQDRPAMPLQRGRNAIGGKPGQHVGRRRSGHLLRQLGQSRSIACRQRIATTATASSRRRDRRRTSTSRPPARSIIVRSAICARSWTSQPW
jgi:hypothetical protein